MVQAQAVVTAWRHHVRAQAWRRPSRELASLVGTVCTQSVDGAAGAFVHVDGTPTIYSDADARSRAVSSPTSEKREWSSCARASAAWTWGTMLWAPTCWMSSA